MAKLTINGKETELTEGTILDAARALGVEIPTMCHLPGYKHFTSCMVCQVLDKATGRFHPACSTRISAGMDIDTCSEEVVAARRTAMELLLSEHLGDCEGPCTIFCPANMNIPLMTRQIAAGEFEDALVTVKQDIALPAVLGRICPAPCENACRRKNHDDAVSICKLKRFVADVDLAQTEPWQPECATPSGKRVGIVGAGPTGFAAAFHLLQDGHACVLFDKHKEAGGALRYCATEEHLDPAVLDQELELIYRMGAEFRGGMAIGEDLSLEELKQDFDAVVLAPGSMDADGYAQFGVDTDKRGIVIDRKTHRTSDPMVFARSSVAASSRMAIRAIAVGKEIAASIHQFLSGMPVVGPNDDYNNMLGKLQADEIDVFMRSGDKTGRIEVEDGFASDQAQNESKRCMHCDCRCARACQLRDLANELDARQKTYEGESRMSLTLFDLGHGVLLEPGKCIKCGICVRICEASNVKDGLTFIRRGYDAQIATPFDRPFPDEHVETLQRCVECCPTAALAKLEKVYPAHDKAHEVVAQQKHEHSRE
jgi:NADPH-dependent glutamate synthase beta subunit-like oxidoreductase